MIKIQQLINGVLKYEDEIENYKHNIHTFINNGATKITIEYPKTTIILTPVKEIENAE